MDEKFNICLVGEVCVDLTFTDSSKENKLRFGGIVHAARALWGLNIPYSMCYTGPDYFTKDVEKYVVSHGAIRVEKIGNVVGSPNLILIEEPKEIGAQGYDFILRDEYQNTFDLSALSNFLTENNFTDIVIFAGSYPLEPILDICQRSNARIHIDLGNSLRDLKELSFDTSKIDTIFLSTSSEIFQKEYHGSINELCNDILGNYAKNFLFKENRGGSRLFTTNPRNVIAVGAQLRSIVHSVGVGDCFDVAYLVFLNQFEKKVALTYASWIASEYAVTTFPDDFRKGCDRVRKLSPEEIISLPGVNLPWEDRSCRNIYIAAPDFDYKDRSLINKVVNCLQYHNFTPRLPIRENGQMGLDASEDKRETLFEADLSLISNSELILAIHLENDPGTLIEIGLAKAMKIPVFVYDPYKVAENLMLTQLPKIISSDLDFIISKIFEQFSKVHYE